MKVFTNHDPSVDGSGFQAKLLKLWEKSWAAHGWEPIILPSDMAKKHKFYDEIATSGWLHRTVNNWPYMMACYSKWMVMAENGGGLYSDPDIMNYGFHPEEVQTHIDLNRTSVVLCGGGLPCCMYGTKAWFENVVQSYRNAAVFEYAGPHCIRDDLSDMNLFFDIWGDHCTIDGKCVDCGYQDWQKSLLVHYHGGVWPGADRAEKIQEVRPV